MRVESHEMYTLSAVWFQASVPRADRHRVLGRLDGAGAEYALALDGDGFRVLSTRPVAGSYRGSVRSAADIVEVMASVSGCKMTDRLRRLARGGGE